MSNFVGLNQKQVEAIVEREQAAKSGLTVYKPLPRELRQRLDEIRAGGKPWSLRDDAEKLRNQGIYYEGIE